MPEGDKSGLLPAGLTSEVHPVGEPIQVDAVAARGATISGPTKLGNFSVCGQSKEPSNPEAETMEVRVPEGVEPGGSLMVQPPRGGPPVSFILPPGVEPGQTMQVQLPAAGGGYAMIGERYSILSKVLKPGESFQGEHGVMCYMSESVKMKARFAGWRMFTGEGLAKLQFTNHGQGEAHIGLTPNMPMSIVLPYDCTREGPLNVQLGGFMAGDETVRVMPKVLPAANCAACCCGGMPPIIQELSGTGVAFLGAGGTVMKRTLAPGETVLVDSHSLIAFTNGINYDVQQVGNFMTCCFGGEGCFNTALTGPGTIWLQSNNFDKLINSLVIKRG